MNEQLARYIIRCCDEAVESGTWEGRSFSYGICVSIAKEMGLTKHSAYLVYMIQLDDTIKTTCEKFLTGQPLPE